jgi:hypothetical protein
MSLIINNCDLITGWSVLDFGSVLIDAETKSEGIGSLQISCPARKTTVAIYT